MKTKNQQEASIVLKLDNENKQLKKTVEDLKQRNVVHCKCEMNLHLDIEELAIENQALREEAAALDFENRQLRSKLAKYAETDRIEKAETDHDLC